MNNLKSPPAFGFETMYYNANKFYKKNILNYLETSWLVSGCKKIVSVFRPDLHEIIFHPHFNKGIANGCSKEIAWRVHNVVKGLGYVPGIGTLVGIGRLYDIATDEKLTDKTNHLLRAVVETLSLGILLLPFDLREHYKVSQSFPPNGQRPEGYRGITISDGRNI
jgi:hypothetical protein